MNNEQALIELKERARFYISTPERAAEALLFIRNLEKFAQEIKEKVKERATKIMDEKQMELMTYSITDPDTGEIREWEIRRSYGSRTTEYRPENVILALGPIMSLKFFKVGKTNLDKFLKKESAKGTITMEQVEKATADPIMGTRKGSGVILKEVKPKA